MEEIYYKMNEVEQLSKGEDKYNKALDKLSDLQRDYKNFSKTRNSRNERSKKKT